MKKPQPPVSKRSGNDASPTPSGKRASHQRHVGLTEATLINSALRYIQRVGLDNLTMRGFAADLGVTQMATYYHFKNKQELLAGVADGILSRIADTSQLDGTWDERLYRLASDTVRELARWPGVAALLMRMDPLPPHASRLIDNVVRTLVDAGFSREQAQMAGSMISTWALGLVAWRDGRGPGVSHPFSPTRSDDGELAPEFIDFALTAMIAGLKEMLTGIAQRATRE